MEQLLGGLFYLAIWVAEVSQFIAVVGVAILALAVIVWGCVGSTQWKLRDAIRLITGLAFVAILLAAIGVGSSLGCLKWSLHQSQ
jgi:hypothetical protein